MKCVKYFLCLMLIFGCVTVSLAKEWIKEEKIIKIDSSRTNAKMYFVCLDNKKYLVTEVTRGVSTVPVMLHDYPMRCDEQDSSIAVFNDFK